MARPLTSADQNPQNVVNASTTLRGITVQHLQSAVEDHDAGCDPRIVRGWDRLAKVADILTHNSDIMDPKDVKIILEGLVE